MEIKTVQKELGRGHTSTISLTDMADLERLRESNDGEPEKGAADTNRGGRLNIVLYSRHAIIVSKIPFQVGHCVRARDNLALTCHTKFVTGIGLGL
jgi:hypothetical protein